MATEANLERLIREAEIQNADVVSAAFVDEKGMALKYAKNMQNICDSVK